MRVHRAGVRARRTAACVRTKERDVGYAILRSIHLLGVIAWIGGMFFMIACLRPAAGVLDPPQRVVLMRAALRRFLDVAGLAALLVLASGAWMIGTPSGPEIKAGATIEKAEPGHGRSRSGTVDKRK